MTYFFDYGLFYRRVLDHIHDAGNIFYDRGRYDAYSLIARLASDHKKGGNHARIETNVETKNG